jgi:D-alanyl-lipoteichoic acid acyltransferase DltB (MBOAT superfamily)
MLFNSWTFAILLALTFFVYHFAPWPGRGKVEGQLILLTVASYVFYAWHTPWLVIILAASTWINAFVTLKLVRVASTTAQRKVWLTFAVLANLGVLAFFKYASLSNANCTKSVASLLLNDWIFRININPVHAWSSFQTIPNKEQPHYGLQHLLISVDSHIPCCHIPSDSQGYPESASIVLHPTSVSLPLLSSSPK